LKDWSDEAISQHNSNRVREQEWTGGHRED
jgi:hypothetical protein